jgi:hypothetical protein
MARQVWTPETPWVKSNKKTQAYWPPYVCRNKNCKNVGRSHPNCKCGAPSFAQQSRNLEYDAEGGEVGREGHFCVHDGTHDMNCEHYADGGQIEANHEFDANPNLAVDHAIASHGLFHALTRTGHSRSENLHKPTEDFLDHAHRGRKMVESHAEKHFDSKHDHPEPSKDEISALREHLESIRDNPSQLLDLPGLPGLEAHSAALGAKAAAASNYFDSIKPKQAQPGPLDPVMPPDKHAEQNYNRQLGVAEKPLSVLAHAKNGTILPSDMTTLQALYPELAKSIQNKTFSSLVDAQTNEAKIPARHRQGLSQLLGQPLDATMTPQAMQAIMHANAGAQAPSQGQPKKQGKSGATAETQKTINKVDNLYKTSLEKIQTEK